MKPDPFMSTINGEKAAGLILQHQASVRGFLVFLGCPGKLIDDVVQDVFLSVLGSGFEDRGPASTAAFLRKVARHLFLKTMHRERREPLLEDAGPFEEAWVEFQSDDGGDGYIVALRECVTLLSPRSKEIVEMRYRSSLQRDAIADRVGMSESGVKSVLVRARKRLRDCVQRRIHG